MITRKTNAIETWKYFNNNKHEFRKSIVIARLGNIKVTTFELLKPRARKRKDFCMKNLKTLAPHWRDQ